MKIMVTGIGGVGGYIASILCANHTDVTLIARKKRKESLLKNGLVLHSDYFGEHRFQPAVTDDPARAGLQDVIFVCVKNYSLESALTAALPCIGPDTIVVLVLNGVDHSAVARRIMTCGHIVDSTMYISAAYNEDYSISQFGKFARMYIGSDNEANNETVRAILDHEGLKCRIAPDISVELWNKYITNCAYNVITTYYDSTIGDAFAKPGGLEEFRTLLDESYRVGKAAGVAVDPRLPSEIYERVSHQNDKSTTSSLARDIRAGHESELETFSGYLVRTAHDLGLSIPLSERFYKEIKSRIK